MAYKVGADKGPWNTFHVYDRSVATRRRCTHVVVRQGASLVIAARLRRQFWSGYGRYIWDRQRSAQTEALVRWVVGLVEGRARAVGERVLDAGCGTGDYAIALGQAGFQVTGIDFAPGMLARAQSKLRRSNLGRVREGAVSLRQASLDRRLPFPDASFDQAILVSVLQAVAEPSATLRELWRVLRPGGSLTVVHHPRPSLHALPLLAEVRTRLARAGAAGPLMLALVLVKSWAERSGGTRYWSAEELAGLLRAAGFQVVSSEDARPIVVVAERRAGSIAVAAVRGSVEHGRDRA